MSQFLSSLIHNKGFIAGFVISFLGLVIPLWQYIYTKRIENKQNNLVAFHDKFMNRLSNNAGISGIDEQVAVIFELRNFQIYKPVIVRVLSDCISRWENELSSKPHFTGLITEAQETIKFLNKNFLSRFFTKLGYRLF